jgi:hypothetical protein
MRKQLFGVILCLAALCSTAQAQAAQCTTNCVIGLTWGAPANIAAYPACSTTITVVCGTGYSLSHTVQGSTVANIDSTTIPWNATTFSVPIPANNTASTWAFTLVTNYKDMTGATQIGSAATCGATNTPPPCAVSGIILAPPATPTGFSGTVTAAPVGAHKK